MTIKIQPPNILDKILGLLGKKRGFILPEDYPSQKWGPHTTVIIRRESFLRVLFRSDKSIPKNISYDIEEIAERLGQRP